MRVILPLLVIVCGVVLSVEPAASRLQRDADTWIETELAREPFNSANWRESRRAFLAEDGEARGVVVRHPVRRGREPDEVPASAILVTVTSPVRRV